MEYRVYQAIERIIDISNVANKWLMWCENNLPEQSVYVPSVFQMRDAFSHIVKMFSQWISEHPGDSTVEMFEFDETAFFASDIVEKQLSEVTTHCFRAFFDVADYIVEYLSSFSKTPEASGYLLLKGMLSQQSDTILDLRSEKANTHEASYAVFVRWDSVLQVLTSAYSFSNLEQQLRQKYLEVMDLAFEIEKHFDKDIIESYDDHFYSEKAHLPDLRKLPDQYLEFLDTGTFVSIIIENPTQWQKSVIAQFNTSLKQLEKQANHYQQLLETMPSTKRIQNIQKNGLTVNSIMQWFLESAATTVVSLLLTAYILPESSDTVPFFNQRFLICFVLAFVLSCVIVQVIKAICKKLALWSVRKNIRK